jgi:hypothetical protein
MSFNEDRFMYKEGYFRVHLPMQTVFSHGRRNFKDTNPFMSFSLVILVGGGEVIW